MNYEDLNFNYCLKVLNLKIWVIIQTNEDFWMDLGKEFLFRHTGLNMKDWLDIDFVF